MPTFGWCQILGPQPTCNTWQLIYMVCTFKIIALDVSWGIFSFKLAHNSKLSNVLGGAIWKPNERFSKLSFLCLFMQGLWVLWINVSPWRGFEYGGWKWTGKVDGQNSLNCIPKYWWIIVASLNDLTSPKPTPENEMNFSGWLWYHSSTLVIRKLYT